jgi:hypothetical protein
MDEKINRKFLCWAFADFVFNITDWARDFMPIHGGDSLEEWAEHFGLPERGITLRSLMWFLKKMHCIKRCREKNLIQLDLENLLELYLRLHKSLSNSNIQRIREKIGEKNTSVS